MGLLAGAIAAIAACSNASDQSTFIESNDSGTTDDSSSPGSLGSADSGSDGGGSAGSCTPTALMSFMPTWSPPNVTAGACATDMDISDAYDSCFAPPVDSMKCDAYKMAHASCFKCVSSNDSDAKHGPLVWAAGNAYFTVNVAGCLAIEMKDTSAGSCAAAFDAAIECKRAACSSCTLGSSSSFSQLSMCENAAGKMGVCQTLGSDEGMKCGDLQAPDAATTACFESSGESLRDLYLRVAPLFCK